MNEEQLFKDRRALIVDDSASMRAQLARHLTELGVRVLQATGALEALQALRNEQVDILFSDLVMPELDGFELCEELRKQPRTAALPVVVVSTHSDSHYITRALRCGADDFLVKPISPERLKRVLARVMFPLRAEVGR